MTGTPPPPTAGADGVTAAPHDVDWGGGAAPIPHCLAHGGGGRPVPRGAVQCRGGGGCGVTTTSGTAPRRRQWPLGPWAAGAEVRGMRRWGGVQGRAPREPDVCRGGGRGGRTGDGGGGDGGRRGGGRTGDGGGGTGGGGGGRTGGGRGVDKALDMVMSEGPPPPVAPASMPPPHVTGPCPPPLPLSLSPPRPQEAAQARSPAAVSTAPPPPRDRPPPSSPPPPSRPSPARCTTPRRTPPSGGTPPAMPRPRPEPLRLPSPATSCCSGLSPSQRRCAGRGFGGGYYIHCFTHCLPITDELFSVLSRADVLPLPLRYPRSNPKGGHVLWGMCVGVDCGVGVGVWAVRTRPPPIVAPSVWEVQSGAERRGGHRVMACITPHPQSGAAHCSVSIDRPKDVSGCPAAPEEWSLRRCSCFLFAVPIVCVCVAGVCRCKSRGGGLPGTKAPQQMPQSSGT